MLCRIFDASASGCLGRAIGVEVFCGSELCATICFHIFYRKGRRDVQIPAQHDAEAAGETRGPAHPGEDAKIVVAAVDVGILNLTNYKPPAPDDYYLGQRRMTSEIRDIYGQLIDGMQGTRGQFAHRRR